MLQTFKTRTMGFVITTTTYNSKAVSVCNLEEEDFKLKKHDPKMHLNLLEYIKQENKEGNPFTIKSKKGSICYTVFMSKNDKSLFNVYALIGIDRSKTPKFIGCFGGPQKVWRTKNKDFAKTEFSSFNWLLNNMFNSESMSRITVERTFTKVVY